MNNYLIVTLVLLTLLGLFMLGNGDILPSQNDIQTLDYVKNLDKIDRMNGFPYPQISHGFKKLSKGLVKPLDNVKDLLPGGSSKINIIRDKENTMDTKRYYLPDYYRKDRLCENDIGSEELRPFLTNEDVSEQSWTDMNVSDHPKFYTSEIDNELTNIGAFFDKNNQYHDKTSSNTDVLTSDSCYTDKMGNFRCEDNSRLQLIPPSLITDKNKCYTLNTIGIYKDKSTPNDQVNYEVERVNGHSQGVWSYSDDRTIHGTNFLGNIFPSKVVNESYSGAELSQECTDCPLI
jgi:hypothetical protein